MTTISIPVSLEYEVCEMSMLDYLGQERLIFLSRGIPNIDKTSFNAKIVGSFLNDEEFFDSSKKELYKARDIDVIFKSKDDMYTFIFANKPSIDSTSFHYILVTPEKYDNYLPTVLGEKFAVLDLFTKRVYSYHTKQMKGAIIFDNTPFGSIADDFEQRQNNKSILSREFRKSVMRKLLS